MIQILRSRPHLWFQLYWVIYLVWFFCAGLDHHRPHLHHPQPPRRPDPLQRVVHLPYCSWFFLLAGVTGLLWWFDTRSYDKLCLMMFSGMTFCLILYMILPNGVDLRPTAEQVGRDNFAMDIMQLIWKADASNNVCPSIHCQSSGLHGPGLCQEQTGPGAALAESAGLRVGGADLRVHRVHQAALGH